MSNLRVYLQKHKGEFVAPSVFTAYEAFRFYGYECIGFEEDELPSLDLTTRTPVIGWVRTVQAALRQIGITPPEPIDYPSSLQPWFGRKIEKSTLGRLRFIPLAQPMFIKPVEHKLFTGTTIDDSRDWAEVADFPDDTQIWTSEIVDFVSEWRCFIQDHRLVGIRHYRGDPWLLPDKMTVIQMIRAWDDAPAGCAIDVGVVKSGATCLVEVNDGFALGDYGLSGLTYFEVLMSRWEQMVRDMS